MGGRVILGSGYDAAKAFIPPNQNKMERARPRMLHPAGAGRLTPCLLTAHTGVAGGGRCLLPPCLHPASPQHQGGSGGALVAPGRGFKGEGWQWGKIWGRRGCSQAWDGAGGGVGPILGCWQVQRPRVRMLFCIRRENRYF